MGNDYYCSNITVLFTKNIILILTFALVRMYISVREFGLPNLSDRFRKKCSSCYRMPVLCCHKYILNTLFCTAKNNNKNIIRIIY